MATQLLEIINQRRTALGSRAYEDPHRRRESATVREGWRARRAVRQVGDESSSTPASITPRARRPLLRRLCHIRSPTTTSGSGGVPPSADRRAPTGSSRSRRRFGRTSRWSRATPRPPSPGPSSPRSSVSPSPTWRPDCGHSIVDAGGADRSRPITCRRRCLPDRRRGRQPRAGGPPAGVRRVGDVMFDASLIFAAAAA